MVTVAEVVAIAVAAFALGIAAATLVGLALLRREVNYLRELCDELNHVTADERAKREEHA